MKRLKLRRFFWGPIGIGAVLTTIYLSVLWFNNPTTKVLEEGDSKVEEPAAPQPEENEGGESDSSSTENKKEGEEKPKTEGEPSEGKEEGQEEDKAESGSDSKKEEKKEQENGGSTSKEKKDESSVKNSSNEEGSATISASLGNLPLEEYIRKQAREIIDYSRDWVENGDSLINSWRMDTKITSLIQALEEYKKNKSNQQAA